MKPELLFHNGTVFDGRRFLPAGTGVRVRAGRITGVGAGPETGSLGPLGSAEPVDLAGGTLLPSFIDAHAHPVFAGHQLRRCDLGDAGTEPAYLEIIARYAREHPDEEWITGGGWELPAFPGGIPARHQRQDDAGRRGGKPHRRHARALPGRRWRRMCGWPVRIWYRLHRPG